MYIIHALQEHMNNLKRDMLGYNRTKVGIICQPGGNNVKQIWWVVVVVTSSDALVIQ